MVGEKLISSINGHDVASKRSQSDKLNSDVEAWLKKKGNKVKEVECTIIESKQFNKELTEHNRKYQKQFLKRIKYRRPFIVEFRRKVGIHAFAMLSKAVNGIVRPSFLYMVYDGENSIKDSDKWKAVKTEALRIMQELDDNS